MDQNHNEKDFTQYYNELKERERTIREEARMEREAQMNQQKIIKIGIGSIIVLLIIVFIIHPIFQTLRDYRKENVTFNVMEKLKYQFHGEFEIIAPTTVDIEEKITPNGLYKVKDKDGIIFNAYKRDTMLMTDYDQYLYRKYVLEYIKETGAANVDYQDSEIVFVGGNLYYQFHFGIKVDDFSQIENAMKEEVLPLIKYMEIRCQKDFGNEAINFITNIYIGDFTGELYYYEYSFYDTQYLINKTKVEYVNYLWENAIKDSTISDKEMEFYHHPYDLSLYVNGNHSTNYVMGYTFENYASFSYELMDYVVNIYDMLPFMTNLEKVTYKANEKELHSFVYRGKTYYYHENLLRKIKGDKVPPEWTTAMLEDFFDAKITYDYENKKINIAF